MLEHAVQRRSALHGRAAAIEEKRLDDFEQSMTTDKLNQWIGNLELSKVAVCLPRFKMTSAFPLSEGLKKLGMMMRFLQTLRTFGNDRQEGLIY